MYSLPSGLLSLLTFPYTEPEDHHNDGEKEKQYGDPIDTVHVFHKIGIRPVRILFPEI